MKVVVTGGAGQLGQLVVAELLRDNHEVLCLDRRPASDGVSPSWTVDLTEPGTIYQALVGADAVIHLAAYIAPGHADDCTTFNANVAMTYNCLHAARSLGLKRVVVSSSIAAYGYLYGPSTMVPEFLPITEDHPLRPSDPYGLSKLAGEQLADGLADSGLSIVSLRLPGINYDPEYRRIERLMADPGFRRTGFWSYIDGRDAARAFLVCLKAPTSGHRIYNIAAPNSNMRQPTQALIKEFFPNLTDIRAPTNERWSGISSRLIEQELGFSIEHNWERVLKSPSQY